MNQTIIEQQEASNANQLPVRKLIYKNLISNHSDDFRSPADWAYKLARRPLQVNVLSGNKVLYLKDLNLRIVLPDENGIGFEVTKCMDVQNDWSVIEFDKLYTEDFGYMKFEIVNQCLQFNLHYNSFLIKKTFEVECKPVLFESIIFDIVNKTIRYESTTSSNDEDDIVRTVRGLEIDGYFISRKNELIQEVNQLCLTNDAFRKAAEECKLISILKLNSPELISAELSRYIVQYQ